MLGLLLAAQIVGAPALSPNGRAVVPVPPAPVAPLLRRPLRLGMIAPLDCNQLGRRIAFRGQGELKRLDELPMGGLQYAVIRMIRGCPIAAPVGYHPTYLLPGVSDEATAKPEDAPTDRR